MNAIKQAIEALEVLAGVAEALLMPSDPRIGKANSALAALRAMPEPVAIPPYIYGREAGANEKVWTEAEVRMLVRERDMLSARVLDLMRATPPTAPVPLSDETIRLAKVALHEMPRPSTDWHEAAKRVCTAVVERAVLGRGEK